MRRQNVVLMIIIIITISSKIAYHNNNNNNTHYISKVECIKVLLDFKKHISKLVLTVCNGDRNQFTESKSAEERFDVENNHTQLTRFLSGAFRSCLYAFQSRFPSSFRFSSREQLTRDKNFVSVRELNKTKTFDSWNS